MGSISNQYDIVFVLQLIAGIPIVFRRSIFLLHRKNFILFASAPIKKNVETIESNVQKMPRFLIFDIGV